MGFVLHLLSFPKRPNSGGSSDSAESVQFPLNSLKRKRRGAPLQHNRGNKSKQGRLGNRAIQRKIRRHLGCSECRRLLSTSEVTVGQIRVSSYPLSRSIRILPFLLEMYAALSTLSSFLFRSVPWY